MAQLAFLLSDLVAEEAAAAFAEHERRIRERFPEVEVRHTGGTSVSGVLTTGDVDLQVRTDARSFDAARDVLSQLYEPLYPKAWHAESAFFVAAGSEPRVEVALTAIGSLDDLHHGEAWSLIAGDPHLIERYNAMKRAHEGRSLDDYNTAKRDFFYENFTL
ncbi:MAG: GrpB family protein [Actinobacteria bacterium]|nr:GrpB family protein [Actinomycetota bacterium]